jgi:hypothetical protein
MPSRKYSEHCAMLISTSPQFFESARNYQKYAAAGIA